MHRIISTQAVGKRMQIQTDGVGSLKRIDKEQNGGLVGRMAGMQAGFMELDTTDR